MSARAGSSGKRRFTSNLKTPTRSWPRVCVQLPQAAGIALRLLAEAAKIAPEARRCSAADRRDHRRATGERRLRRSLGPLCRAGSNDDAARRERGLRCTTCASSILVTPTWNGTSRGIGRPGWLLQVGLAQSMNDPTKGLPASIKTLQLTRCSQGALGSRRALLPTGQTGGGSGSRDSSRGQLDNGLILDQLGQAYRALTTASTIASEPCARQLNFLRMNRPSCFISPTPSPRQKKIPESETLMGRYRQMRPTQAPRDLMRYLSLTPEQQRAVIAGAWRRAVQQSRRRECATALSNCR